MASMVKTLPASWYCSKPLYELEQRAVFYKSWYLLGPVTKFADGKPVEYEFAGVELVVERAGDEFSVLRRDNRQPVPHKLTSSGLVFTALSPEAPTFEAFFPGLEELLDRVDFTKLPHRRTLSYEGRFNWKTMVDGYQECLHCKTTHVSFNNLYPTTTYAVTNHARYSRHVADPAKPDDGLFLYFFPVCTLNVYGGGMTSFRVCPTADPGVTRMEFDYYYYYHRSAGGHGREEKRGGEGGGVVKEGGEEDVVEEEEETITAAQFEKYFAFVRRVALEDYELCETAQRNLERGVYRQGLLNPRKENGVSYYQGLVREMVVGEFLKKEGEREREK
ncbi:hypothetical protein F4778DRAFT_95183 [Xylariomycetidae sp. FL2044]|nr:hypothetical protein F4778DRAFT_95183 [Xylariomycetidae sp. FL2044]